MRRFIKVMFYPICLILLVLVEYIHPTNELYVDLGEHLLRGQLLFQTHQIPITNILSYTYPTFHYIDLEWIAEAILYLTTVVVGVNGLIILTAILTLASLTCIYLFAAKRINIPLASYIIVFYIIALYERAAVLPEVFSYLFLSIFVVILYKYKEKYTNLIWLLIPLQLLWVNMHIYFIIGILLIGLFLFEAIILFKKKDGGRYVRTLSIVFISSSFISLFNPYGLAGLLQPLLFWQNYAFPVSENSSIFLLNNFGTIAVPIVVCESLAAFLMLAIILQFKKVRLVDVLISLVFITSMIIAARNIGLFVFATFIPFTFISNSLLEKYGQRFYKALPKIKNWIIILYLLIIALSLWFFFLVNPPGLGLTHGNTEAVDFFIDNKINGPIFNNYNIGSYLAYRLYPQQKVFVDTRPEAYPASFFQQTYFPMLQNLSAFQSAEKKYGFNTIIYSYLNGVPQDVGFLRYLIQSNTWKVVYLDDSTIIFVKNTALNENIIQKYEENDNTFRMPSDDTSFNSLFNLAHFLDLMGWKKSEIEVNQKMYQINPRDCQITRNILILLGQGNPEASQYLFSYRMYCTN